MMLIWLLWGTRMQDGLPAFDWSDPRWSSTTHRGMPTTYNFEWETMRAADLPLPWECPAAQAAAAAAAASA